MYKMNNAIYRELDRHNATVKMLADHVGISYGTMKNKLEGITDFKLSEMRKIQEFFVGNLSLDELFANYIATAMK